MERQWLHMWNPRVTKITPLKAFSPCCRSVVCHWANRPMSWRTPLGESTFGRNDRISVSVSLTEALSMVFTAESEQKRERKQHILLGSINGVRGRALASHRCGLGSPLGIHAQCGLILSLLIHCSCSSCKEQKWDLHGVLTKKNLKKILKYFS